jgi:prepilin-type N-terminal cleavage/methylation domain-containing protein
MTSFGNTDNRRSGFTMLELLVVLILIAVLTGLALPKLTTAAQKSNIRSTRMELASLVTRARAAAIQRGCVDSLHISTSTATAWVTACQVSGTGRDTVGPVDNLGKRFGVTLSASKTDYGYDPRGILVGFSGGSIAITGNGFSDSVVINNVGKVTH